MGLGNPGATYEATRHNAGAWFVELLAKKNHISLTSEAKFLGRTARVQASDYYWLFIPTTFMNHSGRAVKALCHFYKIPPEAILIAHDDLDFPAGTAKLRQHGGHGGHNGLKDIIQHLQSKNFKRLRIGIGHPGNRDLVTDYVLHPPSKKEHELILTAIHAAIDVIPTLLSGNFEKAMQILHN